MKTVLIMCSNVNRQGLNMSSLNNPSGDVIATSNELQALHVTNQVMHSSVVHQFALDVKNSCCHPIAP